MSKAQQMRWSRASVQPFLDVRTAVLSKTLKTPSATAIPTSVPRTMTTKQHRRRPDHPHDFACSLDPVVMAASAVTQLQTVVPREIGMTDHAVVTAILHDVSVPGTDGPSLFALLRAKLRQGVVVTVIYDSLGSADMPGAAFNAPRRRPCSPSTRPIPSRRAPADSSTNATIARPWWRTAAWPSWAAST